MRKILNTLVLTIDFGCKECNQEYITQLRMQVPFVFVPFVNALVIIKSDVISSTCIGNILWIIKQTKNNKGTTRIRCRNKDLHRILKELCFDHVSELILDDQGE